MQKSKIFLILWISLITIAWGRYNGYGQVTVKIPTITTKQDTVVLIPVLVSDLSTYEIIAYQFKVVYDSTVIKARGVAVERTLTAQWGGAAVNLDSAGLMIVGAFGVHELTAGDTLINLIFEVIAKPGDSTLIMLDEFRFNNDNPRAATENGVLKVTVTAGIRDGNSPRLPETMRLIRHFPEPFDDQTSILVSVNKPGQIEIEIFNLLGQKIKHFGNLGLNPGAISINWNATNDHGERVSPGIYFGVVRLNTQIIGVDRMILLKKF